MEDAEPDPVFKITKEEVIYKRYLKVLHRDVEREDGRQISYDVAATSDFVTIVPFHSEDCTITLIREYGQGTNQMVWALPGGCYEPKKTPTLLECARAELSEEAHLRGGKLIPLLEANHPGIVELKWVKNRFFPFLCIDAVLDENPGQRDVEEEYIRIERLPLAKVRAMIGQGELMLASVQSIIMALEWLKKEGYRIDGW